MNPETTLFTQIKLYYQDLIEQLGTAQNTISMTYLTFDAGEWAGRIAQTLRAKAAGGLYVRLMVDELGEITDEPRHLVQNYALRNGLRAAGVQVDLFRPSGHGLSQFNRLHCKICPDREILQALCSKAEQGVSVNVLLSHQTRVHPVDIANYLHAHRLALRGGLVYRYTGQYMHAKLAWNNRCDVLLGSANLDPRSMTGNFEICLAVRDPRLAQKLNQAFEVDLNACFTQTPDIYNRRSLPQKILSHTCNLASAWL